MNINCSTGAGTLPHSPFLIYGATGYTGKLITDEAKRRGLKPILAGRNALELEKLARSHDFAFRTVGLDQPDALCRALDDVVLVLNTAGPFSVTARPVVDACLRTGTHYIDVTGEIPVFEMLHAKDAEASASNIMIMPGAGYAVVPSDCLARYVNERLPGASRLRIGISRSTQFSRGSAKTMIELFGEGIRIRRDGKLISVPVGSKSHQFDFGSGPQTGLAVSWPDVFTAYHTTGIENIETYFEAGPLEQASAFYARYTGWLAMLPPARELLRFQTSLLPEGPTAGDRAASSRAIVVEATDTEGNKECIRLQSPEAYSLTATTALVIVSKVLNGEFQPGFQTPGKMFGSALLLELDGISLTNLN